MGFTAEDWRRERSKALRLKALICEALDLLDELPPGRLSDELVDRLAAALQQQALPAVNQLIGELSPSWIDERAG